MGAPTQPTRPFSSNDGSALGGAELGPHSAYPIEILTSEDPVVGRDVKAAAQALHTRVYLREGFIAHSDTREGLYQDDYSDAHATYYLVRTTHKDVVSRQLRPPKHKTVAGLPTFRNFTCDLDAIVEVAEVGSIAYLRHSDVVEISALSAERKDRQEHGKASISDRVNAIPFLYARMLRDSLQNGHRLWIANMEEPLIDAISAMTGPGLLHKVGEERQYIGPATIPVAINPQRTVDSILGSAEPHMEMYKDYLKRSLDGLNADKVPKDLRKTLQDSGITVTRSKLARRVATSRHFVPQAALLGYSLARVVPASAVDQFEGSTAALYALDVGTAPTYTYGVMQMYAGNSTQQKLTGLGIAVPSFLAPYAYYYAEGHDYPAVVNAIAGALVVGAILNEIRRKRAAKRREAEYRCMLGPGQT